MSSVFKIVIISVVFSLLTGCAGRDFVRPGSETFKLGQTRHDEIVQKMGTPVKTGDVLKNEKNVKAITYVYAATGGEPAEEGVIPARALSYYFHSDILVGQEFLSSFKSDSSNFDDTKIAAISKGKTTRAEINQLFGQPTSSFIFPMIDQTTADAVGYSYNTTRGGAFSGFKFFTKTLRVTFDEKGIVSDVDFVTSGTK